jgi:hypothetical protein
VIVVQVRDHDEVDVRRLEVDALEAMHEEIVLGEAREGVVANEPGHRAGRHAGVEQDHRVGGAHDVAGNGNLRAGLRVLAVEQQRALRAHEAVL